MIFCKDIDLLHWEPEILEEAAFASQVIASGGGGIAGNTFTATSGPSFVDQNVEAGQVLVLAGAVAGCFPITEVLGATELRVSPLYAELFPSEGSPPASLEVGTASGLTYIVRSFWAQRKVVSDLLAQSVGIVPGTDDEQDLQILNPQALKAATVLGTLQMIYSAIAAVAAEPGKYNVRADLYERLFRRTLRQAQVDLDTDGDGVANVRRSPGVAMLVRG